MLDFKKLIWTFFILAKSLDFFTYIVHFLVLSTRDAMPIIIFYIYVYMIYINVVEVQFFTIYLVE